MRKISILVIILLGSILSPYGHAQCVKGICSRLVAIRPVRASYAAVENGRWYPGKRIVNVLQNRRSTTNWTPQHSLIGDDIQVETYPVPE